MITAHQFIAKWGPGGSAAQLNEEQGAQSHFLDLCELLAVPKPGEDVSTDYLFEQRSLVLGEALGYADVYYRDHFAWENKAPGRNLDAALRQLLQYSLALANPPLLVVCDRLTIRIHTQFNGHPSETHVVRVEQLADPNAQALLRRLWLAPESFRPRQSTRDITEAAAQSFATLAAQLAARGAPGEQVAHFLTQCVFCLFAEDVGLLPERMFERLVDNRHLTSERLTDGLRQLFATMQTGGLYGPDDIPWFNGGLFAHIDLPRLQITDVTELRNAARLNWSAIDVGIFGTLFERGLDPAKRSQLGAHYTDPATIARIIEPVITRPLLREWEQVAKELQALTAKIKRHGDAAYKKARARFVQWLERLRAFRVLDPACGSGNFLFLGLKALKDIELHGITEAARLGLDREQDLVTGVHNLLGIELNPYAAELARISIWIGEIQWRIAHGYQPKTNPVLQPLEQIECRDALLATIEVNGTVGITNSEAIWPKADVVVGNPPFLGDKKMRSELSDPYTLTLRTTYAGRVPGGADLVCYWFEKSCAAIAAGTLKAAGLVATNSIRGGKNRAVLDAITKETRIFEAWSDEPWVNEGAAVRVSLVAFGTFEQPARLNGESVASIHADLTEGGALGDSGSIRANLASAVPLPENAGTAYVGIQKTGPFEIPGKQARQWLALPNPHGQPNSDVVRPWFNGLDVTRRNRDMWIIDFGADMSRDEAALFERPFEYATEYIKPTRVGKREARTNECYWLFQWSRPVMRAALAPLERFIVTPEVAKHRIFATVAKSVTPDKNLSVIARADDTTFGILHSRFHELWSLRMGTSLEDRPRYTPTTCFETFPFPAGLTPLDTAHQRTEPLASGALIPAGLDEEFESNQPLDQYGQTPAAIKPIPTATLRAHASAIAEAAHRLDTLRRQWLNPPEWTRAVPEVVPLGMAHSPYPDRIEPRLGLSEHDAKALQKRTLTQLYNLRPAWLAQAHEQLDAAVAAAYGWADYRPAMGDDEVLRRLLQLNLQRAAR